MSKNQNFKTFASAFVSTLSERSAEHQHSAQNAEARFAQSSDKSDKLAHQRAICHALHDAKLASMSEPSLAVAHSLKLDPNKIEAQSREFKKRLRLCLDALAQNVRVQDRALDAVFQYLAVKKTDNVSFSEIAREAQHETHTQARYMLTFFKTLSGVKSEEKSKNTRFYFDTESDNVAARMLKLYADKMSAASASTAD